jgi:hypothetical protein
MNQTTSILRSTSSLMMASTVSKTFLRATNCFLRVPRVAVRTTASDGVERTQGFVDRVPVGVPLLAAPEEFSYQLFSLLGVADCAKPPRTRLNLYWNLKYIDVRSFILTGAPFS